MKTKATPSGLKVPPKAYWLHPNQKKYMPKKKHKWNSGSGDRRWQWHPKMLCKILKVLWAECSWRRKWSNRPWRGKETVSRSYLSRLDDTGHGRVEIPRRTNKNPGRASNTNYGHHLEGNHPCRPTAFERWYRKTDRKEIPRPEWFSQRSSRYARILPTLILF